MKPFDNFLPLPIVGKSSILNVAEFLDLSLKTSPCTETSPALSEKQSFFLLFRNVDAFIKSIYFFFYHMIKYFCVAFQTFATSLLFLWIQSMFIQSQNYL